MTPEELAVAASEVSEVWESGELDRALDMFADLVSIGCDSLCEGQDSQLVLAQIHASRCRIFTVLGDLAASEEAAQAAVRYYRLSVQRWPGGCEEMLARALSNHAVALLSVRKFTQATQSLDEARAIFIQLGSAGGRDGVASSRHVTDVAHVDRMRAQLLPTLQESREVLLSSVESLRRYGDSKPGIAHEIVLVKGVLADRYMFERDYASAEPLLVDVVESVQRLGLSADCFGSAAFPSLEIRSLGSLATICAESGRMCDCERYIGEARLSVARASEDQQVPPHELPALGMQAELAEAQCLLLMGDFRGLRTAANKVLKLIESVERSSGGRFESERLQAAFLLGEAYASLGDIDESSRLHTETVDRIRSMGEGRFSGSILCLLKQHGLNLMLRRSYLRAGAILGEALALLSELAEENPGRYEVEKAVTSSRAAWCSYQVQKRQEREGAVEKAVAAELASISVLRAREARSPGSSGLQLAVQCSRLGSYYIDGRDLESAALWTARAVEIYESTPWNRSEPTTRHDFATSLEALGRVRRLQGRTSEAHQAWSRSLELFEEYYEGLPHGVGREMAQWEIFPLYRRMVKVCLELGMIVDAWHLAERGRSKALHEIGRSQPAAPINARQVALVQEWVAAEQEVSGMLQAMPGTQLLVAPGAPGHRAEFSTESIDVPGVQRERSLRRRMHQEMELENAQAGTLSPMELAGVLRDSVSGRRVLLVQLAQLVDDRNDAASWPAAVFMMPLNRELTSHQELARAIQHRVIDIEQSAYAVIHASYYAVDRWSQDLRALATKPASDLTRQDLVQSDETSAALDAAYERLVEESGRLIVGPIISAVESALGVGWTDEFEAMLIMPGGELHWVPFHAARLVDGSCLIDNIDVFYGTSCGLLSCSSTAGSPSKSAAVMGPPASAARSLPGAAEECGEVESILAEHEFEVSRVRPGSMTISAFVDAASKNQLVHVASHAKFDPNLQLKSCIQFDDGFLTTDRVLYDGSIKLGKVELLFLSSCHAAWVEGANSDEVVGLVSAFVARGVSSVLAATMRLDDAAARMFARLFYEEFLQGGVALASAYSRAIRRLRDHDGGKFSHPKFWAPLVLHGRGMITLG